MKSFSSLKPKIWDALQAQLGYVGENSPYYQKRFSKLGISSLKDISEEGFYQLPITTKEELSKFNSDFICVPKEEIIDYVTTSGTLGKPVTLALNEADLQRLAVNEENSFKLAGVTKKDIVQITTTLDRRFMAGMAYFLGLRKLGAGLVRVGSGLPELQWDSIKCFQPTYLVAVPSFLIKLATFAEENGIDCKESSVKGAICIGEPLRDKDYQLNALGRKIKQLWDIELFSTYASTEMSTAFTECEVHEGNHIQEDLIFTEVLDEHYKPVQQGEIGELVITTLGIKTMPLIRYATGDMVIKLEENCKCGRKGARLSAILGRKKQQIKWKGTSLYPQQIIQVLAEISEVGLFLIRVNTNDLETDYLEIIVSEELSIENIQKIKNRLRAQLRVTPQIVLWDKKKLEKIIYNPNSRKPIRFLDERI